MRLFRVPEIVLGFVLGIICCLLLVAAGSFQAGILGMLPAMIGYIDEHEGFFVSAFTGLLVLATVLLWRATNALWEAGERQIKIMISAADASTKAAQTAEKSFTLLDRPRVVPTDIGRITQMRSNDNDVDTVTFSIGNYGKVPAAVHHVRARFASIDLPVTAEKIGRPNVRPGEERFEAWNRQIVLGPEKTSTMPPSVIQQTIRTDPIWINSADKIFGSRRPNLPSGHALFLQISIKYEDIASGVVREAVSLWRYDMEGFEPHRGAAFNFDRVIET